jgi:hypothetical protein
VGESGTGGREEKIESSLLGLLIVALELGGREYAEARSLAGGGGFGKAKDCVGERA